MNKKQFIQQIVIRTTPALDKVHDAVSYAERLWHSLTEAGYGESKEPKVRESKDWYMALDPRQRSFFDQFWDAFGYKKDRNGAAMRWDQLGALSDQQYNQIIEAAGKEKLRPMPDGQARKMAQGWLFDRRWTDYQPTDGQQWQQKTHILMHLNNEMKSLRKLYQHAPSEALQEQINGLQKRIDGAK